MPELVITIRPGGEVETLLKDQIFDTRVFGDRRIERLSEVLPTDDGQRFYVHWLKGPLARLGSGQVAGTFVNHGVSCWYDGETMFAETYEDAVSHEIATVNYLRKKGYSFV